MAVRSAITTVVDTLWNDPVRHVVTFFSVFFGCAFLIFLTVLCAALCVESALQLGRDDLAECVVAGGVGHAEGAVQVTRTAVLLCAFLAHLVCAQIGA